MKSTKSTAPLPEIACPRCFLMTIDRPWRDRCIHCGKPLEDETRASKNTAKTRRQTRRAQVAA